MFVPPLNVSEILNMQKKVFSPTKRSGILPPVVVERCMKSWEAINVFFIFFFF